MPNIRRTFPGDDKDSSEEDDSSPQVFHRNGGGKQLVRPGGKYLRPRHDDEDDDEESSSEEEEDPPQQQIFSRAGGGKQLRPSGGGGKYLRPSGGQEDDDDESEDDDEELDDDEDDEEDQTAPQSQTVRVMPRGGGKNFIRMHAQQQQAEDSESESEDDEDVVVVEEETPASAPAPVVVPAVPQARGKMLSSMRPPPQEDDDDSEEDDDEVEVLENVQPIKPVQRGGGKAIYGGAGGGKQLRQPEPEHEEEKPKPTTISRSPAGGKQLRRPEAEKEEETPKPTNISRSPAGGKQLRRAESEEDIPKVAAIIRSPEGGKQLRRPEPEQEKKEPSEASKISRSPAGGKQLRRPIPKEDTEDDDDEDDEIFGDDDDDEESDYEEAVAAKRPTANGRPKRRTAAKKVIVEEDEKIFGDDDVSSDEERELDINNTEALIRDEDDRKYLDTLPELEREAILGERFEKLKNEQDLKKAIKEAKRQADEKSGNVQSTAQRKATPGKKSAKKGTADDDQALARKLAGASRRESTRDKDAKGAKSKKAAALAALKKERKIQKQQDSDDSEMDFGDDSDDDSDEDYDDGGFMPWQKKAKTPKSTVSRLDKDDEKMDSEDDRDGADVSKSKTTSDRSGGSAVEATLEDFKKVTVPRRRLARWCNEPFFEAAILNCFVRVLIGEDENGDKVYRLCEITDVKTGMKVYKFPIAKKGDKPIMTTKTLTLKFGKNEKEFPMSLVSDAPPDEVDMKKYVTVMRNNRQEPLTKRQGNKLHRLQHDLVHNYVYTTEDIERNLQQRKKQGKKLGNFGAELTKATIAVQAGKDFVNEAEKKLNDAKRSLMESDSNDASFEKSVKDAEQTLERAKANLEEIIQDERKMLDVVDNRKRLLNQRAKDQNWAKVNLRAVQANQKADREANKPLDSALSGSAKKDTFNPYARRRVKPKILWEVGQDDDTEEAKVGEVGGSEDAPKEYSNIPPPNLVQETDDNTAALSESHQFAIDEEGLAQASATSILFGSNSSMKRKRNRRGLSLSDYMEQKASGRL
jgi:RNA polymerase-associated protein RTF1